MFFACILMYFLVDLFFLFLINSIAFSLYNPSVATLQILSKRYKSKSYGNISFFINLIRYFAELKLFKCECAVLKSRCISFLFCFLFNNIFSYHIFRNTTYRPNKITVRPKIWFPKIFT